MCVDDEHTGGRTIVFLSADETWHPTYVKGYRCHGDAIMTYSWGNCNNHNDGLCVGHTHWSHLSVQFLYCILREIQLDTLSHTKHTKRHRDWRHRSLPQHEQNDTVCMCLSVCSLFEPARLLLGSRKKDWDVLLHDLDKNKSVRSKKARSYPITLAASQIITKVTQVGHYKHLQSKSWTKIHTPKDKRWCPRLLDLE